MFDKSEEKSSSHFKKEEQNCPRPEAVTKHKVFRGSDEVNWGRIR